MSKWAECHVKDSHLDCHRHHRMEVTCQSSPLKQRMRWLEVTCDSCLLTLTEKIYDKQKNKIKHTTSFSMRPFLSLNFVNFLACAGDMLYIGKSGKHQIFLWYIPAQILEHYVSIKFQEITEIKWTPCKQKWNSSLSLCWIQA